MPTCRLISPREEAVMPSITTWTRLEPRTRHPDIAVGLQARVHDPLWLLGRQFQLGEFRGEWTGSAVAVRVQAECALLSRYHPGPLTGLSASDAAARDYDPATLPLEVMVEGEAVARGADASPRLAANAGLHFLRLLAGAASAYRQAFIDAYPLAPDPTQWPGLDDRGQRYLELMSGRVPDGGALYASLVPALRANPPGLPPRPLVQAADQPAVIAAAIQWCHWYEGLFSDGQAGDRVWDASRLEHRFAVSARLADGTDVTLEAAEFPGGRLDRQALDVRPGVSLGPPRPDVSVVPQDTRALPAPVSFRGMPASRFWQFEDGQVNLAGATAGPADLARLVLLEFGLVYGNDWLLVPLSVPVGSVCRVTALEVTDTFGQTFTIPHYSRVDEAAGRAGAWRMFSLSPSPPSSTGQAALADAFVLPPVLGPAEASAPIEEVRFLRDPMAAIAWAIERVVEGPAGRPLDRFEAWQRRLQQERAAGSPPPAPDAATAILAYRLATRVPDYWIPFVPVVDGPAGVPGALRLQRAAMLDQAGAPQALQPRGRLLSDEPQQQLYDAEVPRAGVLVTRRYRYARWGDGSRRLWIGREKQPGKGEGSSGLRFDVVEPTGAPPSPAPQGRSGASPAGPAADELLVAETAPAKLAAATFRYGLELI
jgi:hypothetical protein